MFICKECGWPCSRTWYDSSLGTVEYMGVKSDIKSGGWVSDCWEGEIKEMGEVDYASMQKV